MSNYQHSDLELKLRAECERGFAVGPKFNTAYIHVLGKVGEDSVASPEAFTEMVCLGNSEEGVYQEALKAFHAYASGKTGTLFWRVYPEIAGSDEEWRTYMRLLISNKGLALVEEMR
jgi:hypothetical protein